MITIHDPGVTQIELAKINENLRDSTEGNLRIIHSPKNLRIAVESSAQGVAVFTFPKKYSHIDMHLHAVGWRGKAQVHYHITGYIDNAGTIYGLTVSKLDEFHDEAVNSSSIQHKLFKGTDPQGNPVFILGDVNDPAEKAYWSEYYIDPLLLHYSHYNDEDYLDNCKAEYLNDLTGFTLGEHPIDHDYSNAVSTNNLVIDTAITQQNTFDNKQVLSGKALQKYLDTNPIYRKFSNRQAYLQYAHDGWYQGVTNETGAIVIKLPANTGFSNTMLQFTIDCYEYDNTAHDPRGEGFGFLAELGCYNYAGGNGVWYRTQGNMLGNRYPRGMKVQWGKDATNRPVIILGDVADTWEGMNLLLRDFNLGWSNVEKEKWILGWEIWIESDLSPYTIQRTIDDINSSATYPTNEEIIGKALKDKTSSGKVYTGAKTWVMAFWRGAGQSNNTPFAITGDIGNYVVIDSGYVEGNTPAHLAKTGTITPQFWRDGNTGKLYMQAPDTIGLAWVTGMDI